MKRTMKLAVALFFPMLLAVTAKAYPNEPVQNLFGHWTAQNPVYGQGVQFRVAFEFRPNRTGLTVDCFFNNGQFLRAQTSAFTNYGGNEIYIQEPRESVVNNGYQFCRATLQPARWTAYFNGYGNMVLYVPVPWQSQFNLVKDYN